MALVEARSGVRARALVPTLIAVTTLVAVISSLGAPLIPTIAAADGVSLSTAQWVLTAALLTGAVATPVMGRLADGPRQRQVVLVALVVVLAGSVLAAASASFWVLVVGRAMQGFGLGLLPVTMAIARTHLSPAAAGRAIATLSITAAMGVGLGYPITGLVSEVFSFHAAYWLGAATVAVALTVAAVVVPGTGDRPARHFDGIGAVTLSVALVCLLLVLSEGHDWGWTSPVAVVLGVVAVVLLVVWVLHELRSDDPLVDLRQVRHRAVLTADASGFLISLSMYLFLPVIVEFVQLPTSTGFGFGRSVLVAGLMLAPVSVFTFVSSRVAPMFGRRFGTRAMIPVGSMLFAAASLFFALVHREMWQAVVSVSIAGFGIGFTFAAMPGFIIRAVPATETGSATGLYQVLRSVGLVVGSALCAAVLTAHTAHGESVPSVGGFRAALMISSAICAVTAVVSYVLPGRVPDAVQPADPEARQHLDELDEESAEVGGAGVMLSAEAFAGDLVSPGDHRD